MAAQRPDTPDDVFAAIVAKAENHNPTDFGAQDREVQLQVALYHAGQKAEKPVAHGWFRRNRKFIIGAGAVLFGWYHWDAILDSVGIENQYSIQRAKSDAEHEKYRQSPEYKALEARWEAERRATSERLIAEEQARLSDARSNRVAAKYAAEHPVMAPAPVQLDTASPREQVAVIGDSELEGSWSLHNLKDDGTRQLFRRFIFKGSVVTNGGYYEDDRSQAWAYSGPFVIDTTTSPKRITRKFTTEDGSAVTVRAIYRIVGNTLEIREGHATDKLLEQREYWREYPPDFTDETTMRFFRPDRYQKD